MRNNAYMATDVSFDNVLNVYKALADARRLRLIRVLVRAETALCVPELVDILMEPQYAISRALGVLRQAGLVREYRHGRVVYVDIAQDAERYALDRIVADTVTSEKLAIDDERLRWRLDLRVDSRCVVTYTRGYNPYGYVRTGPTHKRVLFVCVHNSARSQIAEEYLRREAGDLFEVVSAGIEPGTINPFVARVLAEDGIDISAKKTRRVSDIYRRGFTYAWVITVCSRDAEQKCPSFPGPVRRLNWPFPDPSEFTGTETEILDQVRQVAKEIKHQVIQFVVRERNPRKEMSA